MNIKIKIVSLFLVTATVIPTPIFAATKAGLTPKSPIYFLDTLLENIGLLLTFNAEKKVQKALSHAEEKLAEAEAVALEGDSKAVDSAMNNYQGNISFATEQAKAVQGEGATNSLLVEIKDNTTKHQEILNEVYNKVPAEAKEAVRKAIEISAKAQEEASKQIQQLEHAVVAQKQEIEGLKKEVESLKSRAEQPVETKIVEKVVEKIVEIPSSKPATPSSQVDAPPSITPSGTIPATPATPAEPAQPTPGTGVPATPATPAATATPAVPVKPADTIGPLITALSISPITTHPGEKITFSVTAEDVSGIGNVIYDIRYPNSPSQDAPYYLRPNCNFNGVTSGTCTFTESIPAGVPPVLGSYVIESIRAVDSLNNVSTYYPNGTVTNGLQSTHNLTIPSITILLKWSWDYLSSLYAFSEHDLQLLAPFERDNSYSAQPADVLSNCEGSVTLPFAKYLSVRLALFMMKIKSPELFDPCYEQTINDLVKIESNYNEIYKDVLAGTITLNDVLNLASTTLNVLPENTLKISNIQISDITENSATVSWTTNQARKVVLRYGSTYVVQNSAAAVGNHSIVLIGLSPSTTYHLIFEDSKVWPTGFPAPSLSSGQIFTTLAATPQSSMPINTSASVIHSGSGIAGKDSNSRIITGAGEFRYSNANDKIGYLYGYDNSGTFQVHFGDLNVAPANYPPSSMTFPRTYQGIQNVCEFTSVNGHNFFLEQVISFGDKNSGYYSGLLLFRQNGLYGVLELIDINSDTGALHYNYWYDETGGTNFANLCAPSSE